MKNGRFSCDPPTIAWLCCVWAACLTCLPGSAAAQQPVPLTNGPGDDTEAAWSPDGLHVVFQSDRSGTLGLYLLDASTGEAGPLLTGPGHACFPAWSPDGRWIVYAYAHFTATGFQRQANGYNLFLVSAEGGEPRRLTAGLHRDYCPAFAPDGKTIWFCSDRDRDKNDNAVGLYTISVDGGVPVQMCRQAGMDRALVEPCFSADGRHLACSQLRGFRDNWTIHLALVDSPADTCPLTDPQSAFYSPQWSPAGTTLACTGFVPGEPGWGVYVIDARTARRLRVDCGSGNSRSPTWSPDGRNLVFENNRTGSYKLYRTEAPSFSPPVDPQPAEAEPAADEILNISFAHKPGETIADRSPQANPIAIHGEPSWTDGALSFSPGSFLSTAAAKGFDFGSGPFTVRAVVRVPEDCRFAMITMGQYPDNRLGWQLYVADDRRAWFNSRSTDLVYRGARSDEPLPAGRAVTLIGTRDAAGEVRLYVDGRVQQVTSRDARFAYGPPVQVRIGSQYDGSAPFPGGILELSVVRRTFAPQEILADALARFWHHADQP